MSWSESVAMVSPWIPGHRLPQWSASKVIYFRVQSQEGRRVSAVVVDPQVLQLGVSHASRSFRSLCEPIVIDDVPCRLQHGDLHVLWGSLTPAWHETECTWKVQAPAATKSSGWCRVLCQRMSSYPMQTAEILCDSMAGPCVETSLLSRIGALRKMFSGLCGGGWQLQRGGAQCDEGFSGWVGVDGRFHSLPKPAYGMAWPEWLQDNGSMPAFDCWATVNGKMLATAEVLDGSHLILQIRPRLRGGAKTPHAPADIQKLKKHLITKGVPEAHVDERASEVLDVLSAEQLAHIYRSLEPWAEIKRAVGLKVRLIRPDEAKATRAKAKAPEHTHTHTVGWF